MEPNKPLEEQVLDFLRANKGGCFSDISRELNISVYTARDISKILEKRKRVSITPPSPVKGKANFVIPLIGGPYDREDSV